jgi:hypothetical protein
LNLDEQLVREAMLLSGIHVKSKMINQVLAQYIETEKKSALFSLKGIVKRGDSSIEKF